MLAAVIGVIISSAFSAIVVYAQELVPGRVGMIAGLFFGFAFGMGGLGAAVLGEVADMTSIGFVYHVCSYLPLIGLVTMVPAQYRREPPAPPLGLAAPLSLGWARIRSEMRGPA